MNLLSVFLVFVMLQFTAPADPPNGEKVFKYEAIMGSLAEVIYESAPKAWLYAAPDSFSQAPIPKEPGTLEKIFIDVPPDGQWKRIRIYSYDKAGNRSLPSNITSKIAFPPR